MMHTSAHEMRPHFCLVYPSPLSSTSLAFFLPHLLDDEPLPVEKFFANLDELETTCETVNAINTINVHRYFNRSKF